MTFRQTLWTATLVLCGLALSGCSAVKLAYHQAPHLAYWQLNRYLDLSDGQTERVRGDLGDLHRWHRDTLLPRHAELLQKVQRQLPSAVTPEQACGIYDDARAQFDRLLSRAEPQFAGLAVQLSDAQIRHLERRQADSNADWKKEWLDPTPDRLREQRYQQLLSRAEGFYGRLEAPQKTALRAYIAQSSFDPQRSYAERLRRQKDLVQMLETIARDRQNIAQARALVQAYLARWTQSPDPTYRSYAQALVSEGCAGFALLHGTMSPAQRLQAVASVGAYEQDFLALAAR